MNSLRWLVVAALIVAGARQCSAAAEDDDGHGRRGGQRAKLTDATIRSDERLYRKTPEGELFLHFYYPPGWKASDARPAIVLFFGGGWKTGSYRQLAPQAEYFASRGLVAAAADYRIKDKHKTTPDKAVEDAKSAMRWVRSHAGEFGIDPKKIIAGGGSAGGHLAAATALVEDFDAADDDKSVSSKPCALVLFNPVVNMTKLPDRSLAKGQSEEIKKRMSPVVFLNQSAPPAILFFGTEDKYFPQGREYMAKAKETGARAELYVAPGMSHGFFNRSPWTEVTTKQADAFLAELGYLQGPPTIELPADAPKLEKK